MTKEEKKLLIKDCERCTEWSSTDACEDHATCPVFQLYTLADSKQKIVYKQDVWQAPPSPRQEMI